MKALNIRIPKNLWKFLKKEAFEQEISMNHIIVSCLEKYRNRVKKKLTDDDAIVS